MPGRTGDPTDGAWLNSQLSQVLRDVGRDTQENLRDVGLGGRSAARDTLMTIGIPDWSQTIATSPKASLPLFPILLRLPMWREVPGAADGHPSRSP